MIIYKITNTVNGKVYIGQTVMTLARRWSQHSTSKKNSPMYNAFRKYGADKFTIEALCSVLDPEHLNDIERYFINYYNSLSPGGYNLTSGGDSAFSRSQETKDKQAVAMSGRRPSQETRDKIAKTLTGRPGHRLGAKHTDESKRRISEKQAGRVLSEETKRAMSEAHLARRAYNAKGVECAETGAVFQSASEAARAMNLQSSSILAICRGERKTTGGFSFKFIDCFKNNK